MVNAFLVFCAISGTFLLVSTLLTAKTVVPTPRFEKQMENEFTKKTDNLFENGSVTAEGWSRHAIWRYIRSRVKASPFLIKEWDYYATYVGKEKMWVCMTISDLGYASLYAVAVIDLESKKFVQQDEIRFLTLGSMKLPPTSLHDHEIEFKGRHLSIFYSKSGGRRSIRAVVPNLVLPNGDIGIDADFAMHQNNSVESINIQTTWAENRDCFYLNEKVNGLETRGTIKIGDKTHNVLDDSYTVLDWGRGYWTYENTWYWSSATGKIDNHKVGFNLGYGFSDRSPATENVIFYDDVIHKLDDVTFNIPSSGYTDPWTVTSSDKRVDLKFAPDVDRSSNMNFVVIKSVQHQVFGTFSGTLKLDNGTTLQVKELHGFAEKVYNKW